MLVVSSHPGVPGPPREGLATTCRTGDPWKLCFRRQRGGQTWSTLTFQELRRGRLML